LRQRIWTGYRKFGDPDQISQRVCFGALRPPMLMLCVPTAALLERIDGRGHDPRTASTQHVAERDGAAVDICPF
jgi:hypothetical protein